MSRRVDASAWVEHLERYAAIARQGRDPEGVHQVRVASRRLRVWLDLGGHEALREDLKRLGRGLSPSRDLLLIEALPELAGWHRRRRTETDREVREALEPTRTRALIQALASVPAPRRSAALERLPRYVHRVERSLARLDSAPKGERFESIHRLRRHVRALRFAQDWLGLESRASAQVQESLGQLCDLHAVKGLLLEWALATGQEGAAKALIRQLDRAVNTGVNRD